MSEAGEIAAWLRKQAEADIEAAGKATPGPWEFEGDDPTDDELFTVHEDDSGREVRHGDVVAYVRGSWRTVANGRHMERHDPRTEAERAESVLAVLDAYEAAAEYAASLDNPAEHKWAPPHVNARVQALAQAVRVLAAGYRSREGYRAEWRP